MENDFLLEYKLKREAPQLHRIFQNTVAVMPVMLEKYKTSFPYYTDHTMRHSLNVIDFANRITGRDNIDKMNAEETFLFLTGVYFHDVGMGVSRKDFEEFIPKIDPEICCNMDNEEELAGMIRKYHHELSSEFVKKYAAIFELTDEKYIHAVAEITRGHRVTDLLDESQFPVNYQLSSGNTVCLPYLGALIRMADEIDIGRDRNEASSYHLDPGFAEVSARCYAMHYAITSVEVLPDAFQLVIETEDNALLGDILKELEVFRYKLDICRKAVNGRTKFIIPQKEIRYTLRKPEHEAGTVSV